MAPLYRYSFAHVPPVQSVPSGATLTLAFPDSDGLGPELQPLPAHLFEKDSAALGNPVYGPISVEGAQIGGALRVDFIEVTPDRKIARTLLAPSHGFLPDDHLPDRPRHLYLWEIENGRARIANSLGENSATIPVAPFLGCIATAPASEPPSSLLAFQNGGNIDHPDLVAGTTLWLPVSVPGGLLYLGDMHAAQGHGETVGGGLEISGTAQIRVESCPDLALSIPRYQTPSGIASLAVGRDFENAARLALADMAQWLHHQGWNLFDANMLASQTCEFRVGGLSKTYAVVSCYIASERLGTALPLC
jgi:acetamidase/formamidase